MPTVLFTGFPGFLGSALLPRVLQRLGGDRALCLVQEKFAQLARGRAAEIERADPMLKGRIRIVEGDITLPDLGLGPGTAAELRAETEEVFHLAAVYDLSVGRDLGMRVNVQGTRHVLDFARRSPGLRRLHYVSTCYVSGRYDGVFRETDLECGQEFNNFYEETKYLAEVEVQREMRAGLPVTVYRPSIVVGDSRSGATQKYDGPYYAIRWLLKQPRIAMMPVVGDPNRTELNVVPRDFVVDAIAYLSGRSESAHPVYQLADPRPLTVAEMLRVLADFTGRAMVRVPLSRGAAKLAIDRVPGVYRLMGIPSSAVDYFVHPTRYDTAFASRALEGSGIRAPSFREYGDRLVRFVREHPEIGSEAMV